MFRAVPPPHRRLASCRAVANVLLPGVLAGLLFVGCGDDGPPTAPSTGPSEYISTHDFSLVLPDTLVDTTGTHDIRIHRIYSTSGEERMLRTAESLYPPSARARDGVRWVDKWWFTSFDGVRVCQYATRGALDYYVRTCRNFQDGDFTGTIPMQGSGLYFRSSIEKEDDVAVDGVEYHDVYVARIELNWYQVCGNVCAMGFSRQRTVVFNARGVLMRVVDPEYLGYWVS